jgi:hypothetical protein
MPLSKNVSKKLHKQLRKPVDNMLNEKEWLSINEILLELYKHEDLIVFSKNIMRSLRKHISYTKGCFILLDEEQNTVKEKVCFVVCYVFFDRFYQFFSGCELPQIVHL